jgi:hypothetical protein
MRPQAAVLALKWKWLCRSMAICSAPKTETLRPKAIRWLQNHSQKTPKSHFREMACLGHNQHYV